jgi:hypothetical protein
MISERPDRTHSLNSENKGKPHLQKCPVRRSVWTWALALADNVSWTMEHISDADLMLYCLGVIRNENELKPLEEHLLGCQNCVDRAEEIDRQASKSKGDGGRRDVQ